MKENVKQYLAFKRGEVFLPGHLRPKKGKRARMFKSNLMEALTKAPLWVPQLMYVILISVFLYYALSYFNFLWYQYIIIVFSGVVTWTFLEYIIHRFVYHSETNSKVLFRIQYTGHGVHHHHPKDPSRLAMPPVPSILLSALFLGIFYLMMGKYVVIFMPGFWLGYLLYITLHYYQHVIHTPKFSPFKKLWDLHFIHHGINPYCAFGVTTQMWDYILGSLPSEKDWQKFNA